MTGPRPKTPTSLELAAARLGVHSRELGPAAGRAVAELFERLDRLEVRLEEALGLADRDALTPLLNRRAFVRELTRAIAYADRYGAPASLAYFDVNGLKAVNDRLGHAAGDALLTAVAARLLARVRASDLVGRVGGDEFAVLLAQTSEAEAWAKVEKIAEALAEPLELAGGPISPSVAVGLAELRPGGDAEWLIAAADAAMYGRKRRAPPAARPEESH